MSADSDAPVDLYIAAYADPDAAKVDWDAIKQLAADGSIKVDGLVLVNRRSDGKIHVDDDLHTTAKGAGWGAVGGLVVGLIFPPSLLVGAAVGAGIGAGTGALISHGDKAEIKADVEDTLPINSSGIVAVFEEQWAADVEKALSQREQRDQGEGRRQERRAGQGRREHQQAGRDDLDRGHAAGRLPASKGGAQMLASGNYPTFWDVVGWMIILFFFVIWIFVVIHVFIDNFRRTGPRRAREGDVDDPDRLLASSRRRLLPDRTPVRDRSRGHVANALPFCES